MIKLVKLQNVLQTWSLTTSLPKSRLVVHLCLFFTNLNARGVLFSANIKIYRLDAWWTMGNSKHKMEIFSYWRKTARYFSQHMLTIISVMKLQIHIERRKLCLSTNFWSISIRNSLNKNWKLEYKFYDIFCWWLDNRKKMFVICAVQFVWF